MFRYFLNTIRGLDAAERKRFCFFAAVNIAISLLDIILLAILVFLVSVYSGIAAMPAWQWLQALKAFYLIVIVALLFITKNISATFFSSRQFHFSYQVAARISADKMQGYLDGKFEDHVITDSSVHIRRISHEPVQFSQYILMGWMKIFTEAALLIFTVTAIIIFNPTVFSLLLISLLPAGYIVKKISQKKLEHTRNNINSASEKNIQYLNEALKAYIEANIFGKKPFFKNRYADAQLQMNHHLASLQAMQAGNARGIEIFAVAALLILVGAHEWFSKSSAIIVDISVFLAASYKLIPGVVTIINTTAQIKTFRSGIPSAKSTLSGEVSPASALSSIQLKNISFAFKEKPVIKNLSFTIKKGEMVGLKGRSGKGKSTLVNLISGFLNETSGSIYFNHKEVNAAARRSFWNRVSYARQDAFLVHGTLAANVSFEATADEKKLNNALQSAGVMQFLTGTNESTYFFVAENGRNISGGQKQRIAIARALYKEADLYILDEPFNELDKQSEKMIMHQLKNLAEAGKMVLLITHDEDTLSCCNKVISLDE